MKILIGCEFSGIVRNAFTNKGHDAISNDLIETEQPGKHIIGHIEDILNEKWDMLIAFPPCTYLCNSGVRWLHTQPERYAKMINGANFFKTLLTAKIPKIAIENPIMHKYAVTIIGRRQNQVIQPWQFGHGEIKATCLWLKNLPLLTPTNIVDGRIPRVHHEPPGVNRKKNRSRTYPGIALAMAEQWG